MPPAVELSGITRRYPGVVACDQVNLTVERGTIHAIVGENGAGKSTLMNVLYGLVPPDAGTVRIDGVQRTEHTPAVAIAAGLGMVHQHFMLVPALTVAENVVLGDEPRRWRWWFDRRAAVEATAELARRHRLEVDPRARVDRLSVGVQQRVEILKALHRGARILILDEPTAVLTPQEAEALFGMLRALRARGQTILLITHKLGEVLELADHVTVLRGGRVAGSLPVREATPEGLARMMVGREVLLQTRRRPGRPGAVRLMVRGLAVRDARGLPAVQGVDLEVRAGEILGLAGIEGNGQTELIEALAGLVRPRAGRVELDGAEITGAPVRALHAAGVAHIPEDRHKHGLVLSFDLAHNLILGRQREPRFAGRLLRRGAIYREAVAAIDEAGIRPADPRAVAAGLSGGNQQKLVVARELRREPVLLLASQPTRGVDVGAIEWIHQRILGARDRGAAVLLSSVELDELLALADRIAVLHAGRIVRVVEAGTADRALLGLLMAGAGVDA